MRKNKKLRMVVVLISIAVLCGCSSKEEVKKEVDYNYFTRTEDSHNSGDEVSSNYQEESKSGTELLKHFHEEMKEQNKAAILELTNLSESMEFEGTGGEFVVEPAGNSFENNKGISQFSYLVCYDEQNQCSYYINYGIDDYIYQRTGNETTLLIQETARYLQLWDDKLYFVHAEGTFMTGDICCYDLSSKQLTEVIEGENGCLYVDEDGIHFGRYIIDEQEESAAIDWMMLAHHSTMPMGCDTMNQSKYKDFVVQSNELTEEVELKNRKTGEVNSLFSYDYMAYYRVYDSYVIVQKYNAILVINLSTGEKTIYNVTQCDDIPTQNFTIKDYIIKGHIMYVAPSISNYLITVDLETGTMKYLENENESSQIIEHLYIAGDKIYAYLNIINKEGTTLTEVIVSDQNYCFE